MQGFLKVVLDNDILDNKFFILDASRRQLRIGASKDEASGDGALVLLLDDISSVTKPDPCTIAIVSSIMPPGTKPLTIRAPTSYLADNWYSSLTGQPPGAASSQEKRSPGQIKSVEPKKLGPSFITPQKPMSMDNGKASSNSTGSDKRATKISSTLPIPIQKSSPLSASPGGTKNASPAVVEQVISPHQVLKRKELMKNEVVADGKAEIDAGQVVSEAQGQIIEDAGVKSGGGFIGKAKLGVAGLIALYSCYSFLSRSSPKPTTSGRTVVRDADTGASFIIETARVPASSSGEITFLGMLAWFFFIGAMGFAAFGAWLANKSRRDKGKMTWRFTEHSVGFTVSDHPVQGVIVSEIVESCPTIQAGVRIKGARIKRIGEFETTKDTKAQDILREIDARRERPLVIVFESDDQIEVDSVVESFGIKLGLAGFCFAVGCLFLFKGWMFPSLEPDHGTDAPRLYRVEKVAPAPLNHTVSIWQWLGWSSALALVGLIALWRFVRSFSSSSKGTTLNEQTVPSTTTSVPVVESLASSSSVKTESGSPASSPTPSSSSSLSNRPLSTANPSPLRQATTTGVRHSFAQNRPTSIPFVPSPASTPLSALRRASAPAVTMPTVGTPPPKLLIEVNELPQPQPLSPPQASSYVVPPNLERYVALRKSGLSETAVKIAMTRDNVAIPADFIAYLSQICPPSPVARSPSQPSPSPKAEGRAPSPASIPVIASPDASVAPTGDGAPQLEPKYQRMLDMGISRVTIANAMRREGISLPPGW